MMYGVSSSSYDETVWRGAWSGACIESGPPKCTKCGHEMIKGKKARCDCECHLVV